MNALWFQLNVHQDAAFAINMQNISMWRSWMEVDCLSLDLVCFGGFFVFFFTISRAFHWHLATIIACFTGLFSKAHNKPTLHESSAGVKSIYIQYVES